MLYSNKKLQTTNRYKEYQTLQDKYYKLSLAKEQGQQSFLKYNMILKNQATKEILDINYSFDKYYKKYTKSIEQKVYTIEAIAKEKNLVPVFVTLTLPTQYHPFKSIKYKDKRLYTDLNYEFEFSNIEESIKQGYDYLNHIYRTFYKRVKNSVTDLLYVKVVEAHKTFIPHFHILFFVKKEEIKIIRKNFDNISHEFNLSQTDLELVNVNELQEKKNHNIKTGVNRASKYIMKYITKSLNNGSDYYMARILDGWKRLYKIRIITMSNLDLSLTDFRTIYHNLDKNSKNKILLKSKENEQSIFQFIMKNTLTIKIIKKDNFTRTKKLGNSKSAKFVLIKKVIQSKKLTGGYHSTVDNFKFIIDKKLIYNKPKYIKLRGNYHEYKNIVNRASICCC
ncbi:MAG: replication endonuclease [Aliarcobacter sp.]|jgi:hypothetical protein|nr:replication endonuclease [Aliarcobacter sp.]